MMSDVAAEIKVGDAAPDFNLKDQDQKDVKLSDYRQRRTSCWPSIPWIGVLSARVKTSV